MHKFLIILALTVTISGHSETFFAQRDKQAHMLAGYGIGLTCQVAIKQWGWTRVDGQQLSTLERGWWCTLGSFFAGALFEALQAVEHKPFDANDAIATGIGGAGAALFTVVIDF